MNNPFVYPFVRHDEFGLEYRKTARHRKLHSDPNDPKLPPESTPPRRLSRKVLARRLTAIGKQPGPSLMLASVQYLASADGCSLTLLSAVKIRLLGRRTRKAHNLFLLRLR
jgi:hypothetical protein